MQAANGGEESQDADAPAKPSRDIDLIMDGMRQYLPEVTIEQLKVTHPADDDGLWFFYLAEGRADEIQIESSSGMCPFLIETNRNDERRQGKSVEEVISVLRDHFVR